MSENFYENLRSFDEEIPKAIKNKFSQFTPIEVNEAKKVLRKIGLDNKDINKLINKPNNHLLTIRPSITSNKTYKTGFKDLNDLKRYMNIILNFSNYKIKSIIEKKDLVLSKIYNYEKKKNNDTKYVYFNAEFFEGGKGSNKSRLYPNYLTDEKIKALDSMFDDELGDQGNLERRIERLEREPYVRSSEFNLGDVEKAVDTLRKNKVIEVPTYATFKKEIGNTGMRLEKAKETISNKDALRYYDADTVSKMFYQRGFRVSRKGADGKRDFTWAGKNVQGWDSYRPVNNYWETFGETGRGVKDTDLAFGNQFEGGTKMMESEFISNKTKKKLDKVLTDNDKELSKSIGKGRPRLKWYELTLDDFEDFIELRDKFYDELKEKRMKSKKEKVNKKIENLTRDNKRLVKELKKDLDNVIKNRKKREKSINRVFSFKDYDL